MRQSRTAALIDGRRYRISAEGTYIAAQGGFIDDRGARLTRTVDVENGTVTVELLALPLPTEVGSVILDSNGTAWQLTNTSTGTDWRSTHGTYRSAEQLADLAGVYKVLHRVTVTP